MSIWKRLFLCPSKRGWERVCVYSWGRYQSLCKSARMYPFVLSFFWMPLKSSSLFYRRPTAIALIGMAFVHLEIRPPASLSQRLWTHSGRTWWTLTKESE